MKAELIIPIETLRGALRKDGYYFRIYKGQQIVQRCPRKWTDTPARKAAREKFIEKYGRSKKTQNDPKKQCRLPIGVIQRRDSRILSGKTNEAYRHQMPGN